MMPNDNSFSYPLEDICHPYYIVWGLWLLACTVRLIPYLIHHKHEEKFDGEIRKWQNFNWQYFDLKHGQVKLDDENDNHTIYFNEMKDFIDIAQKANNNTTHNTIKIHHRDKDKNILNDRVPRVIKTLLSNCFTQYDNTNTNQDFSDICDIIVANIYGDKAIKLLKNDENVLIKYMILKYYQFRENHFYPYCFYFTFKSIYRIFYFIFIIVIFENFKYNKENNGEQAGWIEVSQYGVLFFQNNPLMSWGWVIDWFEIARNIDNCDFHFVHLINGTIRYDFLNENNQSQRSDTIEKKFKKKVFSTMDHFETWDNFELQTIKHWKNYWFVHWLHGISILPSFFIWVFYLIFYMIPALIIFIPVWIVFGLAIGAFIFWGIFNESFAAGSFIFLSFICQIAFFMMISSFYNGEDWWVSLRYGLFVDYCQNDASKFFGFGKIFDADFDFVNFVLLFSWFIV